MESASKTGLGTMLGGLLCDRSYCYCIRGSGGVADGSARKVKFVRSDTRGQFLILPSAHIS